MITNTQKNKMKKVFKPGYASKIRAILLKKGITNKKGAQHSDGYISNILNGRSACHDIEEALISLYIEEKEELAKIRTIRKQLFDTKKPEARTSGEI